MKAQALGLQTSTTTSYDQTKTTLQGRIGSRTITDGNGAKTVLGVNPVIVADVFGDTGVAPASLHTSTPNGRVFITKGNALGVLTLSYYLTTITNGNITLAWQGDLKLSFGSNTNTYVIKGFMFDDSNPASMKLIWNATHTTATNGGLFAAFGVNVTDFVKVSVATFPVATLANQTKVTYQLGDNAAQASQTLTVSDGVGIDTANSIAYVLNGAAATPSIFKFDISAPPTSAPAANGYDSTRFSLKTGTLAALTGVVLLNNNVQYISVPSGSNNPNASFNCITFLTNSRIYLAKVTDITSGVVTLPSLGTSDLSLSNDYLVPATITAGQYSVALDKWVMNTVTGSFLLKQCVTNDANARLFGYASSIKTETGGTITPSDFGGISLMSV